jgi:hypothetical protein
VRRWVGQAAVDAGERDGLTTEEREALRRLRRENKVLREARRRVGYRTLDGGAVGCCTCTTRPGPPSPAVITVRYRRTSGVPAAGSTI